MPDLSRSMLDFLSSLQHVRSSYLTGNQIHAVPSKLGWPSAKDPELKPESSRVPQEQEAELTLGCPQLSTHREGGSKEHPGLGLKYPEACDLLRRECLVSVPLLCSLALSQSWRWDAPAGRGGYCCNENSWWLSYDWSRQDLLWGQGFRQASMNEGQRLI